MVAKCIVPGCSHTRSIKNNISLHRFPADPILRKRWMLATKIKAEDIKKCSYICSKHFKLHDYFSFGSDLKSVLQRHAVPSRNIPSVKVRNTEIKKIVRASTSGTSNNKKLVKRVVKKDSEIKKYHKNLNSKVRNSRENKSNKLQKTSMNIFASKRNNSNKNSVRSENCLNRKQIKVYPTNVSQTRRKTSATQTHTNPVKRTHSSDENPVIKKIKANVFDTSKRLKTVKLSNPVKQTLSNNNLQDSISSIVKGYWTNSQESILEIKKKIKNLESKAAQDHKKIDNLEKLILKQREGNIKDSINIKEKEFLLRMDVLCVNYNPKICRLCLIEKGGPLIPLFEPQCKTRLIEKIKTWTGIDVEKSDWMPNAICCECSIQMERAEWFKKRSEEANVFINKFVEMRKNLESAKETELLQEEINSTRKSYAYQIEEFPKIEIENVFSLDDTMKEPSLEMSVIKEEEDIICVEENSLEPTVTESEKKQLKKIYNKPRSKYCKICNKSIYKCLNKRAHSIECDECNKLFWDRRDVKKHRLSRFNCIALPALRTCNICSITFRWKWQLNIHCWQHYKVKHHLCQICDEHFTYVRQLKSHIATHCFV